MIYQGDDLGFNSVGSIMFGWMKRINIKLEYPRFHPIPNSVARCLFNDGRTGELLQFHSGNSRIMKFQLEI